MDSNSDGRATADKAIALRRAYRMMKLRRERDVQGIPLTLEPMHFPCDDPAATRLVIAAKLRDCRWSWAASHRSVRKRSPTRQ